MRKPWGALLAPFVMSGSLAQETPPVPAPSAPLAPLSAPAAPEDPGPPTARPAPAGPLPRPEPSRNASRPEPGWTLRAVPDGSTLALAGGPGRVASLAAFCLGGAPWLALELAPPPASASVRAGFGFSGERVEVTALHEEGAGGAYVIELADGPLAALLAGAEARVNLAIDGAPQGTLSLAGSSATLRAALEDCRPF